LKNTLNATKFGNFAKPYKFECDDTETGSESGEFIRIPEIVQGVDLQTNVVQFWARWILDFFSVSELDTNPNSGDVASMIQASKAGNNISAFLQPAFTFLAEIEPTSPYYGFAKYALKSQEKLAMADVCSKPCAEERKLVQNYIDKNGNHQMCSAPHLTKLLDCVTGLDPYVAIYCKQSPFANNYQRECLRNKVNSRRLQAGHVKVEQLSDGTQSFDLGSLDHAARMHLSGALSMLNGKPSGDLKGYRFLLNSSDMDRPTPNVLLSSWDKPQASTRRLGLLPNVVSWCGIGAQNNKAGDPVTYDATILKPLQICFEIKLPKQLPFFNKCAGACYVPKGVAPDTPSACNNLIMMYCSVKLKFTLTPPWPSMTHHGNDDPPPPEKGWVFGMELGGSVNLFEMLFGWISPPTPVYGMMTFTGGISYSTASACPDRYVPNIEGYAGLAANFGVKVCVGPMCATGEALKISLKLGAKMTHQAELKSKKQQHRRRYEGFWAGHRRRLKWIDTFQPYICQLTIYAKLEVDFFLGIFKGWMMLTFGVDDKVLTLQAGARAYFSVCFVSYDNTFFSETLFMNTLR